VAEEPITLSTLAQFHREVILPDIERVVGNAVEGSERRLRDEMHTLFDSVAQKIDRLETECQLLLAAVRGLEESMASLGAQLDRIDQRMALRSEVEGLKAKIAALQGKVAELEAQL